MPILTTLQTAFENPAFALTVATALGFCIGSFLNVVIARVPVGISIVTPPSRCPNCGYQIQWYDNIPVISWLLLLRGKCRQCSWPIPVRYPVVELLGGAVAAAVLILKTGAWPVATGLAVGWTLLAITMIDLDHKIIPDSLSMPGFAFVLGTSWLPGRAGMAGALMGTLLGAGMFWGVREAYFRLTGREGLGFGDVKLMAMIGALLGPFGVCLSVFAASIVAFLVALVLIATGRAERRTEIPFGPYLAAGGFVIFLGSGRIEHVVRQLMTDVMRSFV